MLITSTNSSTAQTCGSTSFLLESSTHCKLFTPQRSTITTTPWTLWSPPIVQRSQYWRYVRMQSRWKCVVFYSSGYTGFFYLTNWRCLLWWRAELQESCWVYQRTRWMQWMIASCIILLDVCIFVAQLYAQRVVFGCETKKHWFGMDWFSLRFVCTCTLIIFSHGFVALHL